MGITYLDTPQSDATGKITYLDKQDEQSQQQGIDLGRLAGEAGQGVLNSIPGKTIGKLIPGYENARQYYSQFGQPQNVLEQVAQGIGQTVEDLPIYAQGISALRALTGLGPISGGIIGYGGIGAGEAKLQGASNQQALQAGATNAATYPLMHAGGMLGRLAPEGNDIMSRLLSGIGYAAPSALTAPSGQKASAAILGGGLGAIMPERPLTQEQLTQASNRVQSNLESTVRDFYNNLTSGPRILAKRAVAYMAQIPSLVFDHTAERGMQNIDTPLNRDDGSVGGQPGDYRKQLFRDTLQTLADTKNKIGQEVGKLINPIRNNVISPYLQDIAQQAKQTLQEQGIIGPDIKTEVKSGKIKYLTQLPDGTTVEAGTAEVGGGGGENILKALADSYKGQFSKSELEEWLGKPGSESDYTKTLREAAENQLPAGDYLTKVFKRLSNITTVGQAKLLSDSIASKLGSSMGEMDSSQFQLNGIREKLMDAIGEVGESQKKGFKSDYTIARGKYSDFMQTNGIIRKVIGVGDTNDNYLFNDPQKLDAKMEELVGKESPMRTLLQQNNPQLLSKLKDVYSAQIWQVGHPAMFRSRMLKMWLGSTVGGVISSGMGAGPLPGMIGGAAPILATMPAVWRRVVHAEQKLSSIRQQLTTARPK